MGVSSSLKSKPGCLYFQYLAAHKIKPNWWCSEEYLRFANIDQIIEPGSNSVYLLDKDNDTVMFPPVSLWTGGNWTKQGKCWSDFQDFFPPQWGKKTPLDYEFIYNPADFVHMTGKRWRTFRKNLKKFPTRIGEPLVYREPKGVEDEVGIGHVVLEWLEKFRDEEVQDHKVMLKFIFRGSSRAILVGEESLKVYGINIWDRNWHFVNYRYCVCSPIPFLSEYMRYRFYLDMNERHPGILVNDGGVLDRPSLMEFKNKLNPCKIRRVFSWEW
jgi:hypothetical protein